MLTSKSGGTEIGNLNIRLGLLAKVDSNIVRCKLGFVGDSCLVDVWGNRTRALLELGEEVLTAKVGENEQGMYVCILSGVLYV